MWVLRGINAYPTFSPVVLLSISFILFTNAVKALLIPTNKYKLCLQLSQYSWQAGHIMKTIPQSPWYVISYNIVDNLLAGVPTHVQCNWWQL